MTYDLRYIAQFIIEAETPLNISSGEKDALTDSLVMTDANGLPMIPGTSLTGVLRHSFVEVIGTERETENEIFGFQGKDNDGSGSRLIISNAHFVGEEGKVIEGIEEIDWENKFYSKFAELPIRDHAKISHRGTTSDRGKFDNQVVYKGTRFKFEIELIGNENDKEHWGQLLDLLRDNTFRIGGGTRKGYGKLKIISCDTATYSIREYIGKSSRLSEKLQNSTNIVNIEKKDNKNWIKYELTLTPDDFYSFGSGFGDEDVDMTPVSEEYIKWENGKPEFTEKQILIPASSVKGAMSHRVAFHYNKIKENFADNLKPEEKIEDFVGENNEAVKILFGCKKGLDANDKGQRGNVIISDLFLKELKEEDEKILNHVAIDRFTGGAMDGALFDEKVIDNKEEITLEFLVNKKAYENEKENVKKAFEKTLKDIATGMLPLGGSVMRGHGCFMGTIKKDEEENYNEKIK